MQSAIKKTEKSKKTKEKTSKDETNVINKKTTDEKLKKTVYNVSTPRNYVQKSSTVDIYAQNKKSNVQVAQAPKKALSNTKKASNVSPMKDYLKSSPSSVSQISNKKVKNTPLKTEAKVPSSARNFTPRTAKDLPFVNVTVNSPTVKKKLSSSKNGGNSFEAKELHKKSFEAKESRKKSSDVGTKIVGDRQRTKTRTLDENEVKILTPDVVDNNAEMFNLSKKLTAQPKSFYVELEDSKEKATTKTSEDEISYEDDFESYESDFDSYHESQSEHGSNEESEHGTEEQGTQEHSSDENQEQTEDVGGQSGVKEGRDEENMLDSGNFDLRDSRSATKTKPAMEFILEDGETDIRSSLTDEGFQDTSSAVSSIRTVHTDVLDRPLFIDFTKSKENKRKKKIFQNLKQRAKDILGMVTLHEMSYSLFEMKPIPYDLYMATFGRKNCIQTAVQTFDDGVHEEIQTEDIECTEKWTQHPIEFSKHDIYLKTKDISRKCSHNIEDYLTKFTFLISDTKNVDIKNKINLDEDYKSNPLRIYFEQKDGAGSAEMLPYENYKAKLKNTDFNVGRLGRFLKRAESRLSHILGVNAGDSEHGELVKTSKYPFSKGYINISANTMTDEKLSFLKQVKVTGVFFSETKSNLILTVHRKCPSLVQKCVLCLWDVSVARRDPLKVLIAIDDVIMGRFKGGADGVFVAALEDGSVHLWDLSEEPTWRPDVANAETTKLVEIKSEQKAQTEIDREWNSKNSHVGFDGPVTQCLLQACAYTTSAANFHNNDPSDRVVGLEVDSRGALAQDAGRRVVGQVCILQSIGILIIWSIIQEKIKTSIDMGKAYWSKMKLEKNQAISLTEYLSMPRAESLEDVFTSSFNLNAAKKRLVTRKKEKNLKRQLSRPKSAVKTDSDRPASAASARRRVLPENNWENGIICNDLKIMRLDNRDCYLVAKNGGEVLCCTKNAGVVKVNRFCVTTDTSSVTSLDVSPHSLPYFLAATDAGTVNLCSLLESRVLLTLDCGNGPQSADTEKYQADHKGRFLGTAVRPERGSPSIRPTAAMAVKSVVWSHVNPCSLFALSRGGALMTWELTHSDIYAKSAVDKAAVAVAHSGNALALLSADGEVQIHRLTNDQHTQQYLQLFQKYITLL